MTNALEGWLYLDFYMDLVIDTSPWFVIGLAFAVLTYENAHLDKYHAYIYMDKS